MVILRGQKHMKALWKPVVFHGNSMEYFTMEFHVPWSLRGVFMFLPTWNSMEFPWKILHG